mgnify:CR=1 FL=1
MSNLACVALGGGLGSALRAYIGSLPFLNVPWGTFVVNVAGCFLIGLLIKFLGDGKALTFFLVTGFCGGFTTFSAFGPNGSGQVAKMVNQILVLNNYVVLAEALALAEAGGIDATKIPDALAAGHAGSNMLERNFPLMIERNYSPRGFARQILKDLDTLHDLHSN